jgi:glucosamine--fructose-6-phosphate aminotransferase (isomerizing)
MNLNENHYTKFAIVSEMLEATEIVRGYDRPVDDDVIGAIREAGRLLLTGEGSSRIFPAKNAIRRAHIWSIGTDIFTEGASQAAEYDLAGCAVFCASNSGRTREMIRLAKKLRAAGSQRVFGLTANETTALEAIASRTFVLGCGAEIAVAATKSVIEQALFYHSIVAALAERPFGIDLPSLGGMMHDALTLRVPDTIVRKAAMAPTIYFAGYNDGVAEELTLKTNEIARKKSDFLEGTYAVHGIEEVMEREDIVFVIDPIEEETEKFLEVLENGVGLTIVAIADRETPFETILVPKAGEMAPYVHLCAGWNLLVDIGLELGLDLDRPKRARKVGNEITVDSQG